VLQVLRYVSASGKDVVGEWLVELRDAQAREGISELRIDWGPGYRVYYAIVGRTCVLLLCGGDKRKQAADIRRAVAYLRDYKQRTEKP